MAVQEGTAGEAAGTQGAAAREQALGVLRSHWGQYYEITHDEDGWHAGRRDGIGGLITAEYPDSLHAAMSEDYGFYPVVVPGER